MKFFLQFCFLSLVYFPVVTGCSNSNVTKSAAPPSPSAIKNGLTQIVGSESTEVWATEADRQTAQDILTALQNNSEQICAVLNAKCLFPVIVEIYPDQGSFDTHVMNPEMRGFFAISGEPHTIQMVSPANPAPHNISYDDGVSVVIHEFVHLIVDEINPYIPTWLDEGTAIYVGPHGPYTIACQEAFPFGYVPSFHQLEYDYNGTPAPDLFAYTVADFIVQEYGMESLNLLLRTPENLEDMLGVPRETFEESWHHFIAAQYHNNQTKETLEP